MKVRALLVAACMLVIAIAIALLPRGTASAADAGPTNAPACVEAIPSGVARPTLAEKVPARAKAGELIELEIAIRHGAGESATLPADLPNLSVKGPNGEVRVPDDGSFGRGAAPQAVPDPGDATHATTILKVPFVVLSTSLVRARFVLPAVKIILLRKGGGDLTLCTAPHELDVDQPIANDPDPWPRPNPPTLPQITRDERMQEIVIWSAVALAIGAALAAAFLWWRRRPKLAPLPPPPPSPWSVALADITAARKDWLDGKLGSKTYYDRLSDAVRMYLGRLYAFDGLDMTTDEILARIRRLITPVPVEDVATFLGQCDLVKFAGQTPTKEDGAEASDLALYIVRITSPHMAGSSGMQRPAFLAPPPTREVERPRFIDSTAAAPPPPPPPPSPPPPPPPPPPPVPELGTPAPHETAVAPDDDEEKKR